MKLQSFLRRLLGSSALLLSPLALAQPAGFTDAKIQPPQLTAPQRGSLIGTYAQTAFGAADVARGGFALASPFTLPSDRGEMLGTPFPTYSSDAGLSEWGHGWQTRLEIRRWRVRGDLDYATDELSSPWGRLVLGSDGAWYPADMNPAVRVEQSATGLTAYLPDGSVWSFGDGAGGAAGSAQVNTPQGTYAWSLREVVSATGRKTRFTYEANATGRLFVKTVQYGGTGGDFQYLVELGYATLAKPVDDFRSSKKLRLDRRVSTVAVKAKNTSTGLFEARWQYQLTYEDPAESVAFYLTQVDQTYGTAPNLTPAPTAYYTYHKSADALAAAAFTRVTKLDTTLATAGQDAIQPWRATLLDEDEDGRLDFEHAQAQTLYVQEDTGFRAEPLPPPNGSTQSVCRPAASVNNEPRLLARLRPNQLKSEVVAINNPSGSTTEIKVCDRAGALVAQQSLSGAWQLGPHTRFVDLDNDQQPDLIRVVPGGYQVRPNTSGAPPAISFGAITTGTLSPSVSASATWVHDMNGDSIPDIVARLTNGLHVWPGTGKFAFDSASSKLFPVLTKSGVNLAQLSTYSAMFVDVNRDGLSDVLLSKPGLALLFVNDGTAFREVTVPALAFFNGTTSALAQGDFAGSGNTSLTVTKGSDAYSASLDGPETGLLKSADDGKGTVLNFTYTRLPAAPGARIRQPVLASLTSTSSGYDPVTYTYQYYGANYHSQGGYLVGFDSVVRTAPQETHTINFLNGDTFAGLLASMTRADARTPLVQEYAYRQYEDATYMGVSFKRMKEEGQGLRDPSLPASALGEKTENLLFEGVCAKQTVHTSQWGTLTTTNVHANPSGLVKHLHCLPGTVTLTGVHPQQPELDFSYQGTITRNAIGLVEKVESQGPQGLLLLQAVTYTPDFSVKTVSAPGQGTASFEYAPGRLLLSKVTQPDGVVVEATERSPLHDGLLTFTTRRGANTYVQRFRYDGMERLMKQWDTLGGATEANPNELLTYQFATATQPGSIAATSLVDASSNARLFKRGYVTAAGESVSSARLVPEGWVLDGVTTHSRQQRETHRYMRPNLPANTDMSALDYSTLLTGVEETASARSAVFGYEVEKLLRLHADVEQKVTEGWSIASGLLRVETQENNAQTRRQYLDGGKRLVHYQDELNTLYTYGYDALGRLRSVTLPGGQGHRVSYDGYGRIERVERDGVANVEFQYKPSTWLVSEKRFRTPANTLVRTEGYQYDAIGRRTHITHTNAVGGGTQTYRLYYDGASPAQPGNTSWPGFLTAAAGDGYTKQMQYRVDGTLLKTTLSFTGWRTVEGELSYAEGGDVEQELVTVKDENGQPLYSTSIGYAWDAYGRMSELQLDGDLWASVWHNAHGQISVVDFGGGTTLQLGYDTLTRHRTSLQHTAPGWNSSVAWKLNARGLTGMEMMQFGATQLTRQYGYSAQGFLTSAQDAQHSYGYGFDAAGLPSSISDAAGTRALVAGSGTLAAGGVTYTFDGLGRTVTRGNLTLTYGPNGQVATAQKGGTSWSFLYDEGGQRLLKRDASGTPVAAYLAGGNYLDASGLTQPVRVDGQLVGLLKNGVFQLLSADQRGTVMADVDGTERLASPFGDRAIHPTSAAALDYVEKAYDADLGMVRMGVRDYDPQINRFTTPDPVFLEDVEKCRASPVECNLYSYVRNRPLDLVDPTGTEGQESDSPMFAWSAELNAQQQASDQSQSVQTAAGLVEKPISTVLAVREIPVAIKRFGEVGEAGTAGGSIYAGAAKIVGGTAKIAEGVASGDTATVVAGGATVADGFLSTAGTIAGKGALGTGLAKAGAVGSIISGGIDVYKGGTEIQKASARGDTASVVGHAGTVIKGTTDVAGGVAVVAGASPPVVAGIASFGAGYAVGEAAAPYVFGGDGAGVNYVKDCSPNCGQLQYRFGGLVGGFFKGLARFGVTP
ncbi:RHS repeat-associated core domain-containing protein [Hyalangium versicolor]|uniref:RHS repeat-associated core domain-containing protein n=1 Tax=Hyalangium versicolor TaxID=2861190 RepID=UPI001CD02A61|nr:RHS repeat-associated core domain-containing protein [Hyalangium versicolor]